MPLPAGYTVDGDSQAQLPSGYKLDTPSSSSEPPWDSHPLDSAANAISNWWDQVHHGPLNLYDVGKGIAGLSGGLQAGEDGKLQPSGFETFKNAGAQTGRLWQKTKDAYNQGDVAGTAFHLLNYALSGIPGVSSAIDDAGEQIGSGDIAGGVGKTLGILTNLGIGAKAPEIAEGAVNAPAQIGSAARNAKTAVQQSPLNPLRANPTTAMVRGLRPPPTSGSFMEDIPGTISTIKAANPGFKPKVEEGKLNVVPAANRAINVYQDALQPWIDRAEGQTVSGDPIVHATQEGIDSLLPSEQMQARKPFAPTGQSLLDRARQDYGIEFTPAQLRERLALLNERLSPFYNKSAQAQSTALADIPEAVLKRQRDAVADLLYRFLDPENEGAGPRAIQSRTGDLIALRDAALRRQNAIAAEQPLSPLGKIVDPVKATIRSWWPGKATGSGIAFAEGSEGRSLPLVRRAFKAVSETPGVNEIGTIPRPGPRQIAAPPDTSGPVGYNPASVVNSPYAPTQRLLPAAKTQIGVSGVTGPDIIGRSSRGQGTPRALLKGSVAPDIAPGGVSRTTGIAAPSRVTSPGMPAEPPVNILPHGPGAIGPGGTVPVRSTESGIQQAQSIRTPFRVNRAQRRGMSVPPESSGQPAPESGIPLSPDLANKILSGQALTDADWAEIGSHAPPKPPVNPYR